MVCIVSLLSVGVYADSWSVNLKAFKGDNEVSTSVKKTDKMEYYIKITSMGTGYTKVNHWVETVNGTNVSVKSVTSVGNEKNGDLDKSVEVGESYTLNVENAVNTYVKVLCKGQWTPN